MSASTFARTSIVSREEFSRECKSDVFIDVSAIVYLDRNAIHEPSFLISSDNHRSRQCVRYIDELFALYSKSFPEQIQNNDLSFVIDGMDTPNDVRCVSWQTKLYYRNVLLLPDFYYTNNSGYRDFLPVNTVPWRNRLSNFVWRGSTTGGYNQTIDTISNIPRYKLVEIGNRIGIDCDFKFYGVVQAKSTHDQEVIFEHLVAHNYIGSYVEMEEFQKSKFIIQIDGNGNSWELVRKFRLGCCMLLVSSEWLLWHNRDIIPWVHYVPVRQDLSDLCEMIDWCKSNLSSSEEIAQNGRRYALSLDYDAEMRKSVDLVLKHASEAL